MRTNVLLMFSFMFVSMVLIAQEPSVNIINNGSFDYTLEKRKTGTTVYFWGGYDEPLRLRKYFDETTQPTSPTIASTNMPDYVWFQISALGNGRVFVNTTTNTTNGHRALSLYNVGSTTAGTGTFTNSPFQHVVAQRVGLDNAETYQLDFKFLRRQQMWASGTVNATSAPMRNNDKISKFVVGIIAENEIENDSNYTYYQEISIPTPGSDEWQIASVTFDLPAIIAANPGRDFTRAAIMFGMQVEVPEGGVGYSNGEIIIDDVKLRKTPVIEPPVSTALMKNGSFEDFLDFSHSDHLIYLTGPFFSPLRSTAAYGLTTQTIYPNRGHYPAAQLSFPIPNGKWYQVTPDAMKGNSRVIINNLSNTPAGTKCISFFNVGGTDGGTTHSLVSTTPFNHMIAQKVALENTNKYKLEFIYQKPDSIFSSNKTMKINNVPARFVVGIIASNETANNSQYTYYEDFAVPVMEDEAWKEGTLTIDIPAIIAANPGRDFTNAAIFFGMQSPALDSGSGSKASGFNIDDVVLTDITNLTSVDNAASELLARIKIENKAITINDVKSSVSIYNLSGLMLYNKTGIKTVNYTFGNAGMYLVKVDGKTHKVLVK